MTRQRLSNKEHHVAMEVSEGKIKIRLVVNPVWLTETTNLSECTACGDVIYSDIYRLWLMPYTGKLRLAGEMTEIRLCESCYEYRQTK